jgi:hypothetical protein
MLLFVAALIVLPSIALSYQTISRSKDARLGYRSAWRGVTAPRDVTAPHGTARVVYLPATLGDATITVQWRTVQLFEDIVSDPPHGNAFDVLRGPPPAFLT